MAVPRGNKPLNGLKRYFNILIYKTEDKYKIFLKWQILFLYNFQKAFQSLRTKIQYQK